MQRGRFPLKIESYKRVILVDDGIATGLTTKAAILSLRQLGIEKIVLASPVASPNSILELKKLVEDIHVLSVPFFFVNFETYYENFKPVADQEVIEILSQCQEFTICQN